MSTIKLVWQGHFEKGSKLFKIPGKGKGNKGRLVSREEFLELEFCFKQSDDLSDRILPSVQPEEEEDLDIPSLFSQTSETSSG